MPIGNTQSTNLALQETLLQSATQFEAAFQEIFRDAQVPGEFSKYTDVRMGKTIQLMLLIVANHPTMREWLGPRVEKYLRSYSQTIALRTWESTLPIKRILMDYVDSVGTVKDAIDTFVQNTSTAYDEQCSTALDGNSGAGPTGYDGVSLFSTAHPHGPSGNQSNLASGTNLSYAAFDAGRAAMAGWRFENGTPARRRATHMRVGVALETRAKEILSATQRVVAVDASGVETGSSRIAATSIDNVWKGELELIVDPRIPPSGTGAYYWDLMDLRQAKLKPIVLYVGRAPEPIHQLDMDSDRRFNLDELVFGIEGDYAPAAGHWMSCYRGTGTA